MNRVPRHSLWTLLQIGLLTGAVVVTAAAVLTHVACDQPAVVAPPADPGAAAPAPAGTATAASGPIVRFQSPRDSTNVPDDATLVVRYHVDAAGPAQVSLFLDPDADPTNGNERDLHAAREFLPGVTESQVELIGGFVPYGTYFVKARAVTGDRSNVFSASGLVNVVPGGTAHGTNEGLVQVAGLQLLYDTGKPRAVELRIPFVDTWHVVDVLDNLAPRMITPFEVGQEMEVHLMQFYVFGMDEPRGKRVEIYRGTDENGPGEMIYRQDVENHESRRNGWWNVIRPDAPITLSPGRYGITYHAAFEFTEHWAGNAPVGEGYVWVSTVTGAPFAKADAEDFGFEPNFAVRLIGKFTGKAATGARAIQPDRRAEAAEVAAAQGGDAGRDPAFYEYSQRERSGPLHVVWRNAGAIER